MAQEIKELISRQETVFNSLKLICANYKKDSPTRKNLVYLEERLSRLNNSWEKFVYNDKLLEESGATDIQYFTDDVFNITKKMYEEVLQDMLKRKAELPSTTARSTEVPAPQSPTTDKGESKFKFEDIQFQIPPRESDEIIEKRNDLLRQQYCNFKIFDRMVKKVQTAISEPIEKWELEDSLRTLTAKWERVEKVNWELDYIQPEEDSTYQQKYDAAEGIYDHLKKTLQRSVWNNAHYEKATPNITIPEFYGRYNHWLTFRDLYVESVHNNPVLSKAQKMQHLKTKLKGEAERLVQHLGISAENYMSCWEILTHRYDNKRLLFTSFINTMLRQPVIQEVSAATIRQFHDVTMECLNGLKNIGLDITTWDPIIVHLLGQKLDNVTYNEYMKEVKEPRLLPDLEEFMGFLESKFISLEAVQGNNQKPSQNKFWKKQSTNSPAVRNNFTSNKTHRPSYSKEWQNSPSVMFTSTKTCPICHTNHALLKCDKFLAMSAKMRLEAVRSKHVCENCLYNHKGRCNSRRNCSVCHKKHHTLLHAVENESIRNHQTVSNEEKPSTSYTVNNCMNKKEEVLLTTVLVEVKTADGNHIQLRGLLDQGSQVSLITENAAQRLRLTRQKSNAVVSGVASIAGSCRGAMNLKCKSIYTDYTFNVETLVMKKLINQLPSTRFSIENWDYLKNLKLADPQFNIPGPVDLLLGADVYSELIEEGVIRSNSNYPVAQKTKIGWILCGNVKTFNCLVILNEYENMARFWEAEEIAEPSPTTSEEQHCEEHYNSTTKRLGNGQYVVQMPMKQGYDGNFGNTRSQARAQFFQLERKMLINSDLRNKYKRFMNEYISMGHMKPITEENSSRVYLPHHGVLRAESTTTKLRVVFNASNKASSSGSLNDRMYCGPNLQKDMLTLLINWRTYRYVFTADVEKLYRFIWIDERQQHLQNIFWRSSPKEKLQEWQLCTVTYGMKSAPYLAMRTLQQLAEDEKKKFPEASRVLKGYFYMDDLVYGQDTVESSKELVTQLIDLLKQGGFNLRKWKANDPKILKDLRHDQKGAGLGIEFNPESIFSEKMLGMRWKQEEDSFTYQWSLPEAKKHTKRTLLSEICKLYDPLGFLSPFIIKLKLLFQKIWISKIEWDEYLPNEIVMEWEILRKGIPKLNELSIPRWLQCQGNKLEVHGFCDASEKAYACVIYSRVKSTDGAYVTTLITAKTKVAPLSKKITLPRMELCGASLLAKLMEKVKTTLCDKELLIKCWTDSKVVLAWLQGDVNRWENYVASRVTQINQIVPASEWSYVKSEENPADCPTRGLTPSQLLSFNLWWEGPRWLTSNMSPNPHKNLTYITNDELKQKKCHVATVSNYDIVQTLLKRYSKYNRVIRVLAWILRLSKTRNLSATTSAIKLTDCGREKGVRCLGPREIKAAEEIVVRRIQQEYFGEEMDCLRRKLKVSSKSKLLSLTPYLDENGLLRVRGRLINSALPDESKHPIILPAAGKLTELVIQEAHKNTLHGGARLTLAHVRQRFWVMGGSRTVKKELRQCVRCHRFKPIRNSQLMADLPKERVTPTRPFTNTGVDFTGHVDVKINKGRGVKTCKAYIAIFICMVTKAVHLELVSDLTTQTFLAAFKRMCARRGTPKHMFSDNGTNFVGAAKLLQADFEHYKTFKNDDFYNEISNMQIDWHFNAPLWPTAGGLWEAAVKSMKHHLLRVLGEQKLTFEQFSTLLTQIEACLNSRPLCPLTEEVDDLECLTPGHFLIGGPILSRPQEEQDFAQHDLRNRWRLIEQMNLHIWKRWSNEYLHQLQLRSKWRRSTENLKEGSLVLIKEERVAPGQWALGRVEELHPGTDGKVRVVTLKTKRGSLKRPITKLSPLPLEIDKEEDANDREDVKSKDPSLKRRGCRRTWKTYLLSLLLMCIVTTGGFADSSPKKTDIKVTAIPSDHPIYFDEAGKVKMIHDEWTLLVFYNLTNYWRAFEHLDTYISQISRLCQRVSHVYTPCEAVVTHLRYEMGHMSESNSLLLAQHTRQKRGYFNGVGQIARTLFGVLDSDFADKYEKDIRNLQSNDDYLLQLMKNQTLIVEAENNIINKSTTFMQKQFKILQTHMAETSSTINKIVNRTYMLYTINNINSAALTATLILGDLHRVLDMLTNALTNIFQGHFDPHLLPASQLVEQLNIIAGRLPPGLSLPVKDVQKDSQKIYDIIHVKARITTNYFLFAIHIPLLNEESYDMYRIVPIPFLWQGRLKQVQSGSKFIAINFGKESYITLEEQDMHQCTSYAEDEWICISQQPVYSLHSQDAPCEVQVFSQRGLLSCTLKDVVCKENWIKLHKSNLWLFTLCNKQLMRVVCSDHVTPVILNGNGVIALQSKCLLQRKDATIFTFNQLGSSLELKSDIDVPTINSTINNIFGLGWKHSQLNITDVDAGTAVDITKVEQQIKQQKQKEILSSSSDISNHDVYHYTVTSVLIGVLLVLTLYHLVKRRHKQKPTAERKAELQGKDNVGVDIELQEIRRSTPVEPLHHEVKPACHPLQKGDRKVFHFEEFRE